VKKWEEKFGYGGNVEMKNVKIIIKYVGINGDIVK